MYHAPQPYVCDRCGHEFSYSQDDPHSAPVFRKAGPGCPKCYYEFLRAHIGFGVMVPFDMRPESKPE